jgi:hypothetical protein
MTKEFVTVVGTAPYAVTISNGGQIFPGQVLKTELDESLRNHIATGTVNVVDVPEVPVTPTPRKVLKTSTDVAPESTEGESK